MVFSPTSDKQREVLSAPECYLRDEDGKKKYVIITGNPQWEPSPFTLVFVSCVQPYYKLLGERVSRLVSQCPFLSVHLVPWAYETYAILRGSMPFEADWLWEKIIDPLREDTPPLRQNDVDLIVLEASPMKLRWFVDDPNQDRDPEGVRVQETLDRTQ